MQLGLVSNCWQHLLRSGSSIEALTEQALESGLTYVEMRQTCLGECESSDHCPIPDRFAQLSQSLPGMTWNLAIDVPVFSKDVSNDPVVRAAVESCGALDQQNPHLRIVDLATKSNDLPSVEDAADRVVRQVQLLIDVDGRLSLEHSIQPWSWFSSVFQRSREVLGEQSRHLRLCYDACNLLIPGDDVDPSVVSESISVDQLSMIHFKQRRDGQILPTMQPGDIDWPHQLGIWGSKAYRGPALFEIAPSDFVWDRLEDGKRFLLESGI